MRALTIATVLATLAAAQQTISFPTEDGGLIYADLYGTAGRGVVLAHGGQFHKESWRNQANALVAAGFRVLAIDFRGFGRSRGPGQDDFDNAPFHNDVLAAVRYLKANGAKTVSVVGGQLRWRSCRRCLHPIPARGDRPHRILRRRAEPPSRSPEVARSVHCCPR